MATIKELERRAAEVERAEAAALRSLIDHFRTTAVGLPDGSRLAAVLAAGAMQLEPWGTSLGLLNLVDDVDDQQAEQWGEDEVGD